MISLSSPHLLFSLPGNSHTLHKRTFTTLNINNNNNKTKSSLLSTPTISTHKQPYPLQPFHDLCNTGNLDKAFDFLKSNFNNIVSSSNLKPDEAVAILLQACGSPKNIQRGRRRHTSRNNNLFIWNNNNLLLWNRLISSYVSKALFYEALFVFVELISLTELMPNNFTLSSVIKACAGLSDVKLGEAVHAFAIKTNLFSDLYVGNALIAMYGKFGVVESALKAFERMPKRDLVSWNSIMYAYSENGIFEQSYGLFKRLMIGDEGLVPDDVTMVTVIPLCASQGEVKLGMMLHGLALKLGLVGGVKLNNSLVDMYSKCGYLCEARVLFDLSEEKNVVLWSSMINGFSHNELPYDTLDMFRQMLSSKVWPDEISITVALGACSQVSALRTGKELHCFAMKLGLVGGVKLNNSLVDMYSKCGYLCEARVLFDLSEEKNVVLWSSMINGFSHNELPYDTLDMFRQMLSSKVWPDEISITVALGACSQVSALRTGKELHCFAMKLGPVGDVELNSALMDMYSKCGYLCEARLLFDLSEGKDVVSWSSMINGFSQNELPYDALDMFRQMLSSKVWPNEISITVALGACSQVSALRTGKELHCFAMKLGLVGNVKLNSALVDMYSKCGYLCEARVLFDLSEEKDVVLWSSMINGFSHNELPYDTLDMFRQMLSSKVWPDEISITVALGACSQVSALRTGKELHCFAMKLGLVGNVKLNSALVDMYSKCGYLCEARVLFDLSEEKDVVLWSSMIGGYSKKGDFRRTYELLRNMQMEEKVQVNEVTLLNVLPVCVEEIMLLKLKEVHGYSLRHGFLHSDELLASALVPGYAKCGLLDYAERVFVGIELKTVGSWYTMIGAHAQNGFPGKALDCTL